MCGIAGITWKDTELVDRMVANLRHRGPDQHGVYIDEFVTLGHARLSILDLSERGRQPMSNEDGTVWVTHNGEIYNFKEVRRDLVKAGHEFRSATDSEVIVHAYEEYGPKCVDRFNGMFAFAIWDRTKKQLLLARDRLGIKPLYYSMLNRGDQRLVFASEIKAILECPDVDRSIDLQSLYQYMGYEFIAAPATVFASIQKLPPAHLLVWKAGELPRVERYWDLHIQSVPRTRKAHEEELRQHLQEAVRKRLVSDVPVGVCLSGGIDSSALVAMMSRCGVDPIETFSLHYEDETFSEIDYARYVAKQFNTQHHEIRIDPITPEVIETAVWHLDEPMTDLSAVPLYLLSKKIREHVTVCLSGEGGDELLAGYDRFKASKIHQYYSYVPHWIRTRLVGEAVSRLRDRQQKKGAVNLLKRFIEGGLLPDEGGHMRWQYFGSQQMEDGLFSEEVRRAIDCDPFAPVRAVLADAVCDDRLAHEAYVDICMTMPNSLLMKVDKLAMAHALEMRVPFLDHEFVELCGTIPSRLKLNGLTTKAVFRSAMKGILPDHIRRRGKQGYSLPIKNWLRNQLRDYMIDLFDSSPIVNDLFNPRYIQRLVTEHLEHKANHNHILWALINVAIWHRLFIEARTPPLGDRLRTKPVGPAVVNP